MSRLIPATLRERACSYHFEVNHQSYSSWIESLTRHREDFDRLPPIDEDPTVKQATRLGRYHRKSEDVSRWT